MLTARALAHASTHLLLDEPTTHLDVRYQHELLTMVAGLSVYGIDVTRADLDGIPQLLFTPRRA